MNPLSYLYPQTIYRDKSINHELIVVKEVAGRKKVYINGFPQSGPQFCALWEKILKFVPQPKRTLVLGLGGGDVVKLLTVNDTTKIDVVEYDPAVIKLAKKLFKIAKSKKLKIVRADARLWMKQNRELYDLVIVDLYDGDTVPAFVEHDSFLANIGDGLAVGGTVVFNYASHSFGKEDFARFEKQLRNQFGWTKRMVWQGHSFYVAI